MPELTMADVDVKRLRFAVSLLNKNSAEDQQEAQEDLATLIKFALVGSALQNRMGEDAVLALLGQGPKSKEKTRD